MLRHTPASVALDSGFERPLAACAAPAKLQRSAADAPADHGAPAPRDRSASAEPVAPWVMDGPALAALGLGELEASPAALELTPGATLAAPSTAPTAAPSTAPSATRASALAEHAHQDADQAEALRGLADDELAARKAAVDARLAADLSSDIRTRLVRQRDAIEWEQYRRQTERGEAGPAHSRGQELTAAHAAAPSQRATAYDVGARAQLESALRTGGLRGEARDLWHHARAAHGAQGPALRRQDEALRAEATAFLAQLRAACQRTALEMLDASTRELHDAITALGLAGGSARLSRAATEYVRDPDTLPRLISDWRTLSDLPERREHRRRGAAEQAALAASVGRLRALARRAEALEQEERGLSEADWAARDAVDPSRTAANANAALADAWLEAEAAHPILLAFRDPKAGGDVDRLTHLTHPGADLERAALEQAIPKLANILRTKRELTSGRLDPLQLGPVVAAAKQRLRVPPGSVRAALADEACRDASATPLAEYVLGALAFGLSLVSFVPGVGLGAKVLAEAASLAIELHAQAREHHQVRTRGGLDNTALDAAKSVSLHAPELRPILLRVAAAGANAASLAQLTRLATKLTYARATGAVDRAAVVRELDELGERHGLPHLGAQVEAVGGVRGAAVYAPKTFVKDGATRISRLNPEKVRDALKKVAGKAHAHGARLEVRLADATAEGVTGTVRVADAGAPQVHLEVRFSPELTPSAAHGADAGPGRLLVLRASAESWSVRFELAPHLDPRDVDFVLSHELDELAELVRRHPAGATPATLERELAASVLRPGATSTTASAHDLAAARELVALKKDYDLLASKGSANAAARKQTLDRAIEAAGLGEPSQVDAKLRLLRDAGAPEDLLDQVRRVEARRVLGEHLAVRGAEASKLDENLVDHVLWPRERSIGEFIGNGMKGGHHTPRLLAMAWPNGEYVFVEVAAKPAAGSVARQFDQYRWVGPGPMPAPRSGSFPGDPSFERTGWVKSKMPKTTMDDAEVLLREAEDAWRRWLDAGAIPSGQQSNGFRATSGNGVEISGFFADDNGRRFATSIFVEASWF